MMMNFLDLSAASEEERRLISEILSDTSVVNFAEPLRQQHQIHNQEQRQANYQSNNHHNSTSRQHANLQHQTNNQIVRTKTTQASYQPPQPQPHQTHQIQQNNTINPVNGTNPNQQLNHVHNNNTPVTSENHRHANHVQMPSPITGDMNPSIVGMDMTAAQHAGYPMPHPPQAHVSPAYGPPPPHHMYGGPPIFQHYPIIVPYHNLVVPYHNGNMPPYSVLPATNSVVTPRQQVTPQSSQPPSSTTATSSHSRSHSHHPRHIKTKDQMSKQNSLSQSRHTSNNVLPHMIQSNKPNHDTEADDVAVTSGETIKEKPQNDHKSVDINRAHDDNLKTVYDNGLGTDTSVVMKLAGDIEQLADTKMQDNSSPVNTEAELKKISSNEESDAQQSNLDVSKQSQEYSTVPVADKMESSGEDDCNIKQTEQQNLESSNNGSVDKTVVNDSGGDKATKSGLRSSAAPKSWVSLFKGHGSAMLSSSINDDLEQNNAESNNSDDDFKRDAHRKSGNLESVGAHGSKSTNSKAQRSQDAARRALDKLAPKLAQKINSITLKHSLPLLRPRGFINKGNGCYINSTLQALIACPPFYNLMKEIGDLKDLRRENSSTPILDNFAELFLNFPPLDASKKNRQISSPDQRMQISQLQAEALEPKCIYDVLGQIKSECLKGAQEDAEEFLSSVLNGLHEEMLGLSETLQSVQNKNSGQNGHLSCADDINGDSNNDDNKWSEVVAKNRSLPIKTAPTVNTPIQEIFGGSLYSVRTAGRDESGHTSPFFDLQLDISGDNVKSLQDAIKSFTATEVIHDFYCSKTKQKLDAQRSTSLDQLPPILILHLKQFVYTQDHGPKKLMKRIDYPIDLELPDCCLHEKNSDKSLRNSRTYKLLAVVYHEGKEAFKGHYLTDVYHIGSSQWIRCDDSNLKVVPTPRIDPNSSRTPYLLFYRRLNTLKPPQSNSGLHNHDSKKKS